MPQKIQRSDDPKDTSREYILGETNREEFPMSPESPNHWQARRSYLEIVSEP